MNSTTWEETNGYEATRIYGEMPSLLFLPSYGCKTERAWLDWRARAAPRQHERLQARSGNLLHKLFSTDQPLLNQEFRQWSVCARLETSSSSSYSAIRCVQSFL